MFHICGKPQTIHFSNTKSSSFQFHIDQIYELRNPESQDRIDKDSTVIPILSWVNPIPHIDTHLSTIHSNIVLPSTPRPS